MDVECVVVGAGVFGCALAGALARQGREVVVLERSSIAAGASGGPGWRGVRMNGRDPRELALATHAYDLWLDLGYTRTGHLLLSERDDQASLAEQVERQRIAGIDCSVVTGPRLHELEPELSSKVVSAIWCRRDGIVDHTAATARLADEARLNGVEIREGVGVSAVRSDGHAHRVSVSTDDGVITSAVVALAANAGVTELLDLPTFTVYPQIMITGPLPRSPVRQLIGHAQRRLALKTLPGERVMISGGWLGQRGRVLSEEVAGNLADAVAVYPVLSGCEIDVADASRAEAVSPDLTPIVDRVPGVDGAWVATGWSGHGWAIAPAVAQLLAEWIDRRGRPAPLEPFSLARFGGR